MFAMHTKARSACVREQAACDKHAPSAVKLVIAINWIRPRTPSWVGSLLSFCLYRLPNAVVLVCRPLRISSLDLRPSIADNHIPSWKNDVRWRNNNRVRNRASGDRYSPRQSVSWKEKEESFLRDTSMSSCPDQSFYS